MLAAERITVYPPLIFGLLLFVLLLACSALISASEVAYFSLSAGELHRLSHDGTRIGQIIGRLRTQPQQLLATILVYNNFINIAIVVLADYLIRNVFSSATLDRWAMSMQSWSWLESLSISALSSGIEFALTVVLATFILVLFGEVTPKLYANVDNERVARLMARPLLYAQMSVSPITRFMVNWTNSWGGRTSKDNAGGQIRKDDLGKAIEMTVSQESNAERAAGILKSIVRFGEVQVKQIQRSRVDVVAVDVESSFPELMKVVKTSGYSRLPVYKEDFDKIIGILYVKDLLLYLEEKVDFAWQKLIRHEVKYVPEAKKIQELLAEFQRERTHMAIVVDEFGGTAGLVTLEDIMEEVIGDIRDEFDEEFEVDYERIDAYNYVFEGKTLLNDLCRAVGINTGVFNDMKGSADSVAGMILEVAGRIPRKNAEFVLEGYKFKILVVTTRRIEKIQITLPHEDTA